MKRMVLIVLVLLLVACGSDAAEPGTVSLSVTDGEDTSFYSVAELEALGSAEASFRDVTYAGVPLTVLLADAGIDLDDIRAVKASASDGFSANYGPDLIALPDTLVATRTVAGPMTEEDGVFRMVLPDQEGKLNVRQLVELTVIR